MMEYNIGEWSEAYAFVKLLGEGKVHAADENLNKKEKEYYPILKMIRDEIKRHYIRDDRKNMIEITDLDGNVKKTICVEDFLNIADVALEGIIKGKEKKATFEIPELEKFLNGIEIIQFKASSRKKSDLDMVIKDLTTNTIGRRTFSIKSELGSKATILNASKATNFVYKIEGMTADMAVELDKLKNTEKKGKWLKNRISKISNELQMKFEKVSSEKFASNLRLIDSLLPEIISDLLVDYYSIEGIVDIKTLTERLSQRNPLNLSLQERDLFYETKVKELINAATFGMMPTEKWDKTHSVTGGILTVKKNGDVLCHHIFYGKKSLDEYLYRNTKLDTPSTSRHNVGEIYKENEMYYTNLNLQIRMK